jgi:superkiller protein 3
MRRSPIKPCAVVALFLFLCGPYAVGQKVHPQGKAASPLAAAKFDIDHNNLDAAEKAIWNVLSASPSDQEALTLLGIVRGRQQRFAEAEALFQRVLQLNPKAAVAARNLASAMLAQNKPDEAIQEYRRALDLSPQNADLRMELARLLLERGKFADALSSINTAGSARLLPAEIPLKAASLLGLGRKVEAEQLIVLTRGSPGVALDLAQVFVAANDPDAALKTLSFVTPVPKTATAHLNYLKGRALRQQGDTAAAMVSFRAALAADPKSTETMVAMAEALAALNQHADSLVTLEQAGRLDPDSPEVLRHLIVEAMHAGKNDRALEAAQELQQKSSELDDRYLVASVMLQQKQFAAASHILEDYAAQRPGEAKVYLGLGIAYLNLLRYPEAREAFERSAQLNPDVAEAQYQLGVLASQQGRRDEAIQHWQKAIVLKPDHAQALFFLGTMDLESGQLNDAESLLKRSLAADPNNMKTEYDLALVLNKLGNADEAKQHFERYRTMQDAEHANGGNPAEPARP